MSEEYQANKKAGSSGLSEEELQELVAASDSGSRNPAGPIGLFLAAVALAWSAFQVLLASPLANYVLPSDLINNSRQVHLAFAIFLAFMAYPALKSAITSRFRIVSLPCPVRFSRSTASSSTRKSSTTAASPTMSTNGLRSQVS